LRARWRNDPARRGYEDPISSLNRIKDQHGQFPIVGEGGGFFS
jgi:hypothetical protein